MRLDLSELDDEEVSELGKHLTFEARSTAVLAEFKEGDEVDVSGRESSGVITSVMTSSFEFPTGKSDGEPKTRTIEASSDDPVYVVAMVRGGMVAVDESKLSSGSIDAKEGDPEKLARQSEEAAIYDYMTDAHGSVEELREAKVAYIQDRHEAALSDCEPPQMTYEELLNIPGVDDPEAGFSSLPDGWDRSSVLKAWASLGGTWTSCRTQMSGDISRPKRFCAALKDEVLMTEAWRGKF